MRSTLREVRGELTAIAAALDPALLPQADAVRVVAEAGRIQRLAGVIASLAATRVAAGGAWRHGGARSAEEWFANETGTSTGKAKDQLDTAATLGGLPAVDAAARNGDLSPEQASEVASAAAKDPSAQEALLRSAKRKSLKGLKEDAERVRNAWTDADARHARAHRRRSLRTWTDRDGAAHLHLATTPDLLAELHARLAPHERAAFDTARREGRREGHDAYAHDGFLDLLRSTGDAGSASSTPTPGAHTTSGTDGSGPGTDPGPSNGNSGTGPGCRPRTAPRPPAKIIVTVDLAAFRRGHAEPGETCQIAGVGTVPLHVARDLLGDALLALVIRDGTDIRTITHLGRGTTAHQRTALELRDPCCVVPGCDTRTGLEIDHSTSATGWADTRRTTLDELARLCHTHHQHKTHDGWTLTGSPGRWRWDPPGGAERDHTTSARSGTDPPAPTHPPTPRPPHPDATSAPPRAAPEQGDLLTDLLADDHAAA